MGREGRRGGGGWRARGGSGYGRRRKATPTGTGTGRAHPAGRVRMRGYDNYYIITYLSIYLVLHIQGPG